MTTTAGGTIVDRTIHQTFPHNNKPTTTPSTTPFLSPSGQTSSSCSPQIEFLHRINGTSIIQQTTTLLRLSARTYATSTTIFHRFYHRKSLFEFDVWSIAMASVLLGCKIEEEIRRVSDIILIFVHVYRRMRFAIDYIDHDDNCGTDANDVDNNELKLQGFQTAICSVFEKQKDLNQEERRNLLRYVQPLPRFGPVYKEWEEELMNHENIILRELGFTLYWIPESHPHNFLLYFMRVLDLVQVDNDDEKGKDRKTVEREEERPISIRNNDKKNISRNNGGGDSKSIAQIAWNYCNDSCRLDLCVRYGAELIACAAIYLSCLHENKTLPLDPRPWWHVFIGPSYDQDLVDVCNALLALRDENCVKGYREAMRKYVISMVDGGSFIDPGSFIWNYID